MAWLDWQYVAGELAVTLIVALVPPVRRKFIAIIKGVPGFCNGIASIPALQADVRSILYQVSPNGSGSMNDRMVRVEASQQQSSDQCSVSIYQCNLLTDQKGVAAVRTDVDGNVVYVSKKWCELAGIQRDEAMGNGWIKAIRAADQRNVITAWREAVQNKQPYAVQFHFNTGKYVESRCEPMKNDGRVIGWQGEIEEVRGEAA